MGVGERARLLMLADTHLGLDLPERPRIPRRRRGDDFLAGYEAALAPAFAGRCHALLHGGDVFHRPDVSNALVERAAAPLRALADAGVEVFIVPGNHERGRLPHALWLQHPRIHVFDRPRTFVVALAGLRVAFAGFPYGRDVRRRMPELVHATGAHAVRADVALLCVHQCFEGARVGGGFTFRDGADVIAAASVPPAFAALLSGHVHRGQMLRRAASGRPLSCPVLYPGSVERTSIAEHAETKGYLELEFEGGAEGRGVLARADFRALAARPMVVHRLSEPARDSEALERAIAAWVAAAPPDAILCVRLPAPDHAPARAPIATERLRALVPPSMNADVGFTGSALRVRV